MADVALVIVAVDGLWRRLDRVPPDDRNAALRAACAGVHVAVQTNSDEDALAHMADMLRFAPIPIWGPGYRCHLKGRMVAHRLRRPEVLLARLVANLAREPDRFDRRHVLVIGAEPADVPLLQAAGTAAWVPELGEPPCVVSYVSEPSDGFAPGVAEVLERLVLRNNRFKL